MLIEELLNVQAKYSNDVQKDLDQEEILNKLILALFVEVGEFANEVQSFKYWKNNKETDKDKILFEFIDILKIWGSVANYLDIGIEDIERVFYEKSKECEYRKNNGY